MKTTENQSRHAIPIVICRDTHETRRFLVDVFGFWPDLLAPFKEGDRSAMVLTGGHGSLWSFRQVIAS